MKKIIAGLVLALMVIALPVGLVGCKKAQKFEGVYKFVDLVIEYEDGYDGHRTPASKVESYKEDWANGTLTINEDGTAVLTDENPKHVMNMTWVKDGTIVTFKENNSVMCNVNLLKANYTLLGIKKKMIMANMLIHILFLQNN